MFETFAPLLVRFLICFVIGSIPFAVVSMIGSGIDIRKVGSGNPGFNNVLRVSSRRAVAALAGDMGKGALAVWLVLYAWPAHLPGAAWAAHPVFPAGIALGWSYGLAAVLGHCFSPFLRFNGGKGIATSGGVMLVLYPVWAVIALAYFTAARVAGGKLKWREAGTIASLTTWVLFVLLMLFFVGRFDAACAAVMLSFLTWRHKKNLQNLLLGPLPVVRSPLQADTQVERREDEGVARQLTTDN
jgi:glycerol-3-phosphate acyltransferase PlsY